MQFQRFLTRLDDESIQQLLGKPVLRLVRILDSSLASRTKLLELITHLYAPATLLRTREYRNILIEKLKPREAQNLATVLGVESHQQSIYKALSEASIYKGSKREEILFEFFGLRIPPAQTPEKIFSAKSAVCNYGLFTYQRKAARDIQQYLQQKPHRVVLHMPTGSGKTRTTMNIIAEHLRQKEPGVVVWLAHSEELCQQAAEEFTTAWQYLGNRDVELYQFWGDSDLDIEDVNDGFVVAGLQKTDAILKRNTRFITRLGRKTSLIIIDEAHSAIAETYSLILDVLHIQNRQTGLLGLTATPGRTWSDIAEDEKLAEFFGRKKVSLKIPGYSSPVNYLVDQGYLARATFTPLNYDGGENLSARDIQNIQDTLDISPDILAKLAEDEKRNLRIISRLEELANDHNRIIVFAATVKHSEVLAAVLSARGLKASSITSDTGSNERAKRIKEFRTPTDNVQILCNFGVLTTGFDAPQTSAALIARPTKSLVLYSQMVGRAIRGPKAGGNTTAEIVTVVDQQLPGFRSIAEAFANWEDIWE